MPKVKRSYAYIMCIRCDNERYRSLARYQKMLEKQSPDEIDKTFICGRCKREIKSEAKQEN